MSAKRKTYSNEFKTKVVIEVLENHTCLNEIVSDYNILLDSKEKTYDNIIIERFWRNLKYENVYLTSYSTIKEAKDGIGEYINFYNYKRPHVSLGYKTPKLEIFDSRKGYSSH
jgi:hypothetical protein